MTTLNATIPYVYDFAVGDADDPMLLGGKGAGLARLVSLGLPVPPGFIVSTRAGRDYLTEGRVPARALDEIQRHLAALEAKLGRSLGDATRPLLVSVRSGAPVSMPGMMDTVLNVGLTPATVDALAAETADPAFAWACYERLAESYARIVREVPDDDVEERLLDLGGSPGEDRSRAVVAAMNEMMTDGGGAPLPDDATQQIAETIEAVFRSWTSPRANAYRKFRGIDPELGTAAVVQTMVFGNRGETSGSGVAFTRDPSTGEPGGFGDFLFNAQGEDVVAGTHDPSPLEHLGDRLPATYAELLDTLGAVEANTRDLCEVEFTVDEGALWILQTRVGQRSGPAAVRAAVAFVDEGVIGTAEALGRVTPAQVEAAGSPAFAGEPDAADVLARGLAASPGAVTGQAVFDVNRAVELGEAGEDVILLRPTTSPADVAGFIAARGIVTGLGGRTSHAAVVARGMGRPAVCGVGAITIAADGRSATVAGVELAEGTRISLDGHRGIVSAGERPFAPAGQDPYLERLLGWFRDGLAVPVLSQSAAGDAGVLLLDDPQLLSAKQANQRLAELNGAGTHPPIFVSARWATAADRVLEGSSAGIGCIGDVVAWPVVARGLRAG